MAKSDLRDEKKKRKRQDDDAAEVTKKSKKSKKSVGPAAEEAIAVPEKKAKKDKKEKKSKKSKKDKDVESDGGVQNGAADEPSSSPPVADEMQQDFIGFGDEPMPGTVNGSVKGPSNGTISRKASKKEKKGKQSKKEAAVEEEPAQVNGPSVAEEQASAVLEKKSKDKKPKKSKKSKDEVEPAQEQQNGAAEPMDVDDPPENAAPAEEAASNEASDEPVKSKKDKKKSKKEKKASKSAEQEAKEEALAETNGAPASEEAVAEDTAEQNGEAQEEDAVGKKDRFIVFVGNIPYTATKESIEAHFEKLKPFELRLRTYKGSEKFMGTAFIEFTRYDHMQTALTKYHHSVFPTGDKKNPGRKINVELSAGGGGNTQERMEKIKYKNEKLANERLRKKEKRDEVEAKQKERKEKKGGKGGKEGEKAPTAEVESSEDHSGMHPARLAMMKNPSRRRY